MQGLFSGGLVEGDCVLYNLQPYHPEKNWRGLIKLSICKQVKAKPKKSDDQTNIDT